MRNKSRKTYLVVNGFIQVLDENVTLTSFTESGVTLRPHDPAEIRRSCQNIPYDQNVKIVHVPCTVLNQRVVELLESPFA